MDLKNLIVQDSTLQAEHPSLEGFIVTVAFISKEKTRKMLDRSTITKFSKKTHKPEEEIDNDLFLNLYSKALIKGWKGLKYEYLNELLPVDLSAVDNLDEEMEYTEENALSLLKNSTDFDSWLSAVISDITAFNKAN